MSPSSQPSLTSRQFLSAPINARPTNGKPTTHSSTHFITNNPKPKKLLDQVHDLLRAKHYSDRTEEVYTDWIYRYVIFHHKRHPAEMGAKELN